MSKKSLLSKKVVALTGTALLGLGMLSTAANAATTLKWAHVYETGSPYHQTAVWAAQEVEKQTQGRVKIKTFPASSLGKEVELNEGIDFGGIDIIYTGDTFASRVHTAIGLSSLPFMIRNFDHWKTYRDSDLFNEIKTGYEKKTGNEVTAFTYYGARHVTSNKPINSPSDMEGLKIRVPNAPMFLMFPKGVKANATPLAFSEVYLALQQGLVDAQENPLPTIKFKKFYEVQKYINLTGHMTNSLITVVSKMVKSKISDADYQVVVNVTKEAAAKASEEINTAENNLAAWFKEQGVTVNEVNKQPFIDAMVPVLAQEKQFDADMINRLKAL